MKKLLFLFFIPLLFVSCGDDAAKEDGEVVDLKTEKDRLSYVLGAMNSKTIVGTPDPNIARLDMELVAKGFSENLSDSSPDGCEESLKKLFGPNFQDFNEAYAKEGKLPETPLREEQPRLPLPNFYYAQEDEVYSASERDGFTWSIHRPHTVIGYAVGNAMNMGTTLAVYASICKETGRKFIWPGSSAQWNGISDVTDARILAKQLVWASKNESAKNKAFNITNGDIFRWKWLWYRLADYFGLEAVGFENEIKPLEKEMQNDQEIWSKIVKKFNLKEEHIQRLTSPWHTDLDLGRPLEVMTDMANSRKAGFSEFQSTEESFLDLFKKLKEEKLIP